MPPVSGKLSTLVVLMCLLLPVAVLPGLLNVPPWLAVDAVLGLWWLTLVGAFGVLLYRGARLADVVDQDLVARMASGQTDHNYLNNNYLNNNLNYNNII